MIDLIDLSDWKTKREILSELNKHGCNINERRWRKYVSWYNKQFCNGVFKDYIVHGQKGYKLTSNIQEIEKSIKDYRKRAMDMLVKTSEASKAIGRLNQEELDI